MSSKAQNEQEKKLFEVQQHNALIYLKITQKKLEIMGIDKDPEEYNPQHHTALYWVIRELSREKISVDIVRLILKKVFVISDIQSLQDQDQIFQILLERFKFCQDLAKTCKVSVQELLRFSSKKVYANIVRMVILCPESIKMVETFIGIELFKNHILPKSWFYLIQNKEIDSSTIEKVILKLKVNDAREYLVSIQEIKDSLHHCVCQIAWDSQTSTSQKRTLLCNLRNTFRINNDQEFLNLFRSKIELQGRRVTYFESELLLDIIDKLGMNNNFMLETLLSQRDPLRVLVFYSRKQLLNSEFFKGQQKNEAQPDLQLRSLAALKFIAGEFKKNDKIEQTDMPISLLEAFNQMYTNYNWQSQQETGIDGQALWEISRQSKLIKFIRAVELIFKNNLCENASMKNALINQVIYVLKLGTDDEAIVDMSIYSLQILLNAIGIKLTTKFLDRFLSIAVHAYLKYTGLRRIKNYTKRIFDFYLKDKFTHSQPKFTDLQFIFLNKIQANASMREVVQLVQNDLYCSEQKIHDNLVALLRNLKCSSEDIRVLSAQYLLEVLENKNTEDPVRKVLVSNRVLKIAYLSIIDLKQDYATQLNVQFSIFCGKIVAAIGLQHNFVNDTVQLKARNQKTLMGSLIDDEEKRLRDVNIASDYFNPITNQSNNIKKRDETIEILAVPLLNQIKIQRQESNILAFDILNKLREMTNLSDDLPKNYFYSLFLLSKFIQDKNYEKLLGIQDISIDQQQMVQQLEDNKEINEIYAGTIARLVQVDVSKQIELEFNPNKRFDYTMLKLCLYLIQQIEEKDWQQVFISCIPAIRQSQDILRILLPYITYYSIRFNHSNTDLVSRVTTYFNEILTSESHNNIDQILKTLDFLTISVENDKMQFKVFLEEETKFRYVEKLFLLDIEDTKTKDENILTFIKKLGDFPHMKHTFLLVKKFNKFKLEIKKESKFKGALKIKNYKRCIQSYEDDFRQQLYAPRNNGKNFLEIFPSSKTIEIVKMYKEINDQDFNSDFFNCIQRSELSIISQLDATHLGSQQTDELQKNEKTKRQTQTATMERLRKLMESPKIVSDLKERNWNGLKEWLGDFNLVDVDQRMVVEVFRGNQIRSFEIVLCLIFAEYHRGLQLMLRSYETLESKAYIESLERVKQLINQLYQFFMLNLSEEKEGSYNLKLFLHVLYEIDSALHFLKDYLHSQKEVISELICKDIHKDKRRFERIYYDFDMKQPFEHLLGWFESRSQSNFPITSYQALSTIYLVRKLIFAIFERDNEVAVYLMKIAKLERKNSSDVLRVNQLFRECELNKHRIIDFEYEYAKFILKFKNAHDSYQYLVGKLDDIKGKCEKMQKDYPVLWVPQKVFEKAVLLSIELQIKIDPRNSLIQNQFAKYVKDLAKDKWEKPYFKFASYLDMLDTPAIGITQPPQQLNEEDKKKRLIQKIFYYMKSLEDGHKYIWQSLPRALQLWFDYKDEGSDDTKIQTFMKHELGKLENFKLATVLQILLSRYAHPNAKVRETIQLVLSKLSVGYPGQSAWWIFHFLYFEERPQKPQGKQKEMAQITRAEFAKELLNKITSTNAEVSKQILDGEKLFFELKKLSEKQPSKSSDAQMDMPQYLQRIQKSSLVMPIEENLSVQLPPKNYKKNYTLQSLVSTAAPISEYVPQNAIIQVGQQQTDRTGDEKMNDGLEESIQQDTTGYPAYKEDPVLLSGFTPKVTIMHSKEKPKKIGILGSDGQVYNFLLKWDKHGDLRKEQRFIDFAVLCNKMLENDGESRKRNLRLRTYAIVPLSRNTGLIEWIQNTQTLKNVVGECWRKNNIKGEMSDIKKKAEELAKGDTHTLIWSQLKQEMKPVLGNWLQDHFFTPEIWYEAKINFIRSTAIWSMIGYVIGLGDRHGDNILIHSHTGEVTHVDFDCIFEKGAKLRVPEIVPFRLTANIVDGFGIFQEKGVFEKTCQIVMRVLRKNTSNILSFLFQFIHDPLIEAQSNVKVEIKEGLSTVEKKLNGHLSNQDSFASATIEEQVEQVILNAINDESLKQMYIGWMPWL